jgi:hypothetical protein
MKYAICSLLVLTLCTSALLAADAELVVEDAQGNEVLRLDPDDASTGPQNLPAGRYNSTSTARGNSSSFWARRRCWNSEAVPNRPSPPT